MRLEKGISREELDKDATNAPDVARVCPAKAENDLGRAVMTGRHNRRVVLILESCRSEVNQSDLGIEKDPPLVRLAVLRGRGRRDFAVVCEGLICVVAKKDVLGLEIGMNEVQIVQDYEPVNCCGPEGGPGRTKANLQATLVKSWRAKLWIWLLGKGTKLLLFRKSKTLWPRRSMTMQMWPR